MRVLPVKVDQKLADGLELRERRRPAVDLRAASSLRVEHAPQEERSVLREIVLGQPGARGRRVIQIELGGDFRAIRAEPQLAATRSDRRAAATAHPAVAICRRPFRRSVP